MTNSKKKNSTINTNVPEQLQSAAPDQCILPGFQIWDDGNGLQFQYAKSDIDSDSDDVFFVEYERIKELCSALLAAAPPNESEEPLWSLR